MTDFEKFQSVFKKWQVRFGLTGYNIYFENVPLDYFADITINEDDKVATVRLDKPTGKRRRGVALSAKHEAIHLLIYSLEHFAVKRYVSESEINTASEELVHKLEGLIGD